MLSDDKFDMLQFANKIFSICRSLTGEGVRQTLDYINQELLVDNLTLTIHGVPTNDNSTGKNATAFDWELPKEWQINSAYVADMHGNRIIDFNDNNLHVMGYSLPIDEILTLEDLKQIIYTIPECPEVIPYVTSYYKERVGFCMAHKQLESLSDEKYHAFIDSKLFDGVLNYGELIIKGESTDEILLSTYICHPSMANNEVSGICVLTALAKFISKIPNRYYTYRVLFVPETIGSIIYISQHLQTLKKTLKAGYIVTCVGDNRAYSYLESRNANTLADRAAKHVLSHKQPDFVTYSYLDRGSDERQYNAPGVDLPVCSIMRTKYAAYPEYHTSADNLSIISNEGLNGALDIYKDIIILLENNFKYEVQCLCEPQLGKRGLYPTESYKGSAQHVREMMNFIAYSDGKIDLIEQAEKIGTYGISLIPIIEKLIKYNLLTSNR